MSRFKFPSPNNTNNNPKEFQFSANKYKPSPTRELPSISYLRSKLIPYTFCQPNDFYDLPQTILIFTESDDDDTCIIPGTVKSRGRIINYSKEYSNIPMNNIVYQSSPKKLKSVLLTFLDQIIKPRFRDAFNRIESEFTNTIVLNHQLDDAIHDNTALSVSAAQQIKRYADYQMMRGDHKVAFSLYHQLVAHFPTEKSFAAPNEPQGLIGSLFSFGSQAAASNKPIPTAFSLSLPSRADSLASATLCAACCDIIIGEVTSETVKSLNFLRDSSINMQQRLFTSLLTFWVLPRIGQPSPDVIMDFLDFACASSDGEAIQSQQLQQPRGVIRSSSFTSVPILSSIHASFSLNNIASAIYRQLSSDDFGEQAEQAAADKSAFKLTFPIIVEPFLHEQIIQFYSRRQLPFQYFLLARRFEMIGQKENYVRCLWNSFITLMGSEGGPQYHNCELCLAFLIEKIVNVLLRQRNFTNQPKADSNWFLADYIGYLMRFDSIQRLPVFASLFSMWDSRAAFYKAGFIRASVMSFETKNPKIAAPRKFRGSWKVLATRLFGVQCGAQSGFFFDAGEEGSVCDTVAHGDEIRVRVAITNKAAHFSVGEAWLRARGCEDCARVSVGSSRRSVAVFCVRPGSEGGFVHIDGLNARWVNNVNLFTLFQRPLCFRCLPDAPSLSVEEVAVAHESFAGEASMVRLVLHVGSVPLSSLSLLIEADDEFVSETASGRSRCPPSFTILSPQARCIGGQFFFGPVAAGEDLPVTIMHTCTSAGFHSHWLFFTFEAEGSAARYAFYNFRVDVIEPPGEERSRAAMFPSFFGLYDEQRIEVSLRPVSESGTFQLSLSNSSKREARCVCVQFLQRKEANFAKVQGSESFSECLSCGFESDFGSYFNKSDVVKFGGSLCEPSCVLHDYSPSFDSFIIYGFTRKIFTSIGARKSVAFCFGFESLDHETYPYLRVSVGDKSYISDMSTIMHHYDMCSLEKAV